MAGNADGFIIEYQNILHVWRTKFQGAGSGKIEEEDEGPGHSFLDRGVSAEVDALVSVQ